MAVGDGGFRTRAASLLRPSLHAPSQTHVEEAKSELSPAVELLNEKSPLDDLDRALTQSSADKTSDLQGDFAAAHDIDANRIVRTIPTWVHSINEDDEDVKPTSQLISHSPPHALVAQHNSSPSRKSKHRAEPPRGRLHDLQREWAPPTPSAPVSEQASKWRAFANSSAYPAIAADGGELVTEEWLVQNGADYSRPWLEGLENGDAENDVARHFKFHARRKSWWERLQRTILRSPVIPLVIRTIVWIFSFIALVFGALLHNHHTQLNTALRRTQVEEAALSQAGSKVHYSSPNMAVIVDAIALVYILYITYDEYTGKPLGLRSAKAKMRLIFLDLFFIVFDSANLSLAFEAVSDSNSYCDKNSGDNICKQQKALASVLLVALISWLLTFSISVLRLVERVTGK